MPYMESLTWEGSESSPACDVVEVAIGTVHVDVVVVANVTECGVKIGTIVLTFGMLIESMAADGALASSLWMKVVGRL